MIQPGVSLVICTYNGASKLPDTLMHIARQKVPGHIPWEFILVDNNSSDTTQQVARGEWDKYNHPVELKICEEQNPGLSYARSKGFSCARYEYIILCDDDNWLDENYVRLVYEVMLGNGNIGALGGNGELVYETEPPEWVKEFSVFAGGAQASKSGPVKRNTLYGAGCVIRKSAYEKLFRNGFKSLLTDRLGKELSSGGDYELCYALCMAGYDIWYDSRLKFRHYIPKERFTEAYYLQYLRESSKCFEVLEPYKIICEKRLMNFKNFRLMMYKLLFYYIRKYIYMRMASAFFPNSSVQKTIFRLRSYSIHIKISLLVENSQRVFENYRHGKSFEQKFMKSNRNFISKATESIFTW